MFKKSALLVTGLALAACGDQPVGGTGYFDTIAPTTTVQEPVRLVPVASEQPDMTAALSEAVELAIAEGEATEPEIEVAQIDEAPSETEGEADPADSGTAEISTDDGTLNLNITSQEQQKIERDKAAILLAAARAQYEIIEPGALPNIVAGVNIALYARETTNAVGDNVYRRPIIKSRFSAVECGKFEIQDDAQRYFLANDGPEKDPLNLDPDGDGFACRWSPEFYRSLR
ncbi:hypothetical protein A9Q96_07890 [Rhodobacterales bacterium 52_120_T64]|nr:hypothetical protein A9Q96_07890 [Rhodobacterales bacterium 52_120_T64]